MDDMTKATADTQGSSSRSKQNSTFVVADIGGTNARFAMYSPDDSGKFRLYDHLRFRCGEFSDLASALKAYLDQTGHRVDGACVSIAAPTDGDHVHMTNLNWEFSISDYKQALGLESFLVINDGVAAVLATTAVEPSQIEVVKPGQVEDSGCRLNLIPGTGFGLGCIVPHNGEWVPIKSEGGHATVAAVTREEFEVLQHITEESGRAVSDRVLSGPGMFSLYKALAAVRGEQTADIDIKEMTSRAIKRQDKLCADALDLYCTLLGRLAGDLALTLDAHGGIYLSGNVLQLVGVDRLAECFNKGFVEKGRMTEKVGRIPVSLLRMRNQNLLGASVWVDAQISAGKLTGS
jgi:glucokinase